ncbi:hypothetical protein LXA43DRAFT_1185611 [Ganoderma leucocontextum]|nr:hypothetical protein LXA43DRAFT_1185611 [Ganoderma leucocontextum]
MVENTVQEAGQFSGNTPLTGHNIQGHSVSAILVREVPEDVLTTSVTHYGTQGMYGKPMQRTPKHDQDNERRRKWRAAQSLKREATRKANKKAQFERVSGRSPRDGPMLTNPGIRAATGSAHLIPILLFSMDLPLPVRSSLIEPFSQHRKLSLLAREHHSQCEYASYTRPAASRGVSLLGTDVCAASRTDGPNSSQYDGPTDQGHTRPTYNEYATWTAGNCPGRHGCENYAGFPPIAYQTSTALVAGFDQHHLGAHEQHAASVRYSGAHIQSPSPYATTTALSSHPEVTYVADNSIAHFSAPMLYLERDNGDTSTGWSLSPPATWSKSTSESQLGHDLALAAQESTADRFNAAYKDVFVHRSLDDHHPVRQPQAVDLELSEHYANTSYQVNGHPPPHTYLTATTFIDSTTGTTACYDTGEKGVRDVSQVSDVIDVAQPEGGASIVWSAPPVVVVHMDQEQPDDVEGAVNDAHAHTQDLQVQYHPVPPQMTHNMDPVSTHAEGLATTPRATASAVADTSLHVHRGVSADSPGPFYLASPYPLEITISEDEYASVFEGCIEDEEPLSSDILSLLLGANFVADRGTAHTAARNSDRSQQRLTTSTSDASSH